MKKLLSVFLLLTIAISACKNEPKTSTTDELVRLRADLDKHRQELSDKREIDRLEEEMRRVDAELEALNGKKTVGQVVQPTTEQRTPANTGIIVGSNVVMRANPSIKAEKTGAFNKNETVTVLNKKEVENANEAILTQPIALYTDANSSGSSVFSLPKGKGVVIERYDETAEKLFVSYQHPEKGKLYASIPANSVENIELATWYQIRRSNGQTGWVFGKFLKI